MGIEQWGIEIQWFQLSTDEAQTISSAQNSLVNNCSIVTIYTYGNFKLMVPGDIEAEGMKKLLARPDFLKSVEGVKVLVAPHHGHKSGFSSELMNAIGKPTVVFASVVSKDENVDSRYSSNEFVKGLTDGTKLMTTRTHGTLKVIIDSNGGFMINPIRIV